MKKRLAIAAVSLLTLLASFFVAMQPAQAAVGIRVSNGRIVEANGNDFIMRGVSHPHAWYTNETESFAEIKQLGANTVRVVLSASRWGTTSASELSTIITLCRQNRLICVLEVHDTTGYQEDSAAISLDAAVNYWISVRSALQGQENYVIINIGNEPWGNNSYSGWTNATINAIQRMRDAGFDHALMVDAPNWGQDWAGVMRDNAQTVFNSDPDRNTIFSIHMYGVYDTAAEITSYIDSFVSRRLPLVIGEFGHNHSDGDPDEDTIMATAQAQGIGYIGWSYSGNSGGVEYLDMVYNFNPANLTPWGQRIFNGPNGIRETAREATIYSGQTGGPTSSSPSSPSVSPSSPSVSPSTPGGQGCTASYRIVGQWPGGFQGEVSVTSTGGTLRGWTVTWTYTDGQTITSSWGAQITTNGASVTATNLSYNPSGGTFGFLGTWNGTNSVPTLTCTAR